MTTRRLTLGTFILLCALVGLCALPAVPVRAAVSHAYLSQITEVPAGSGVSVAGPLSSVRAATVDSGHLWVAEPIETEGPSFGTSRIDEFDAASGAFVAQFPQPAGVEEPILGIAVGHGTGEGLVYTGAYEPGGHQGRVAVFNEAGVLLGAWTGAHTPNGSFGFGGVVGVAVDGSLGGPASGDVYVLDNPPNAQGVVDVFKPEAAGVEPLAEHVAQLTGTCPVEGTSCTPLEVLPFGAPSSVAVNASNGDVLVVDHIAGGNVIDVFEPQLLGGYVFLRQIAVPVSNYGVRSVAVDGSTGEVYVTVGSAPGFVDQFSSTGVFLGQITGEGTPGGGFRGPASVAVDPESHRVFVGDRRISGVPSQPSVIDVFGPDLVIPDVTTGPVSNVTPHGATLTGTVKLNKEGQATCQFVWGTTKEFGQPPIPCSAPVTIEESSVQASLGQATSSELEPDTTYYYRLQASNKIGLNPGEPSQDQQFTTPGPGIHEEASSNVTSTSATLDARIDPHNAPTTYYFQYGLSGSYGTDVLAPPGVVFGSGAGDVEVAQHLQGLSAGTIYHYRVVAVSEPQAGVFETFDGPDRTLTTQSPGAFTLPDGRSWEMVSPPDKHGAGFNLDEWGRQASVDGNAVTYATTAPTEAEPQGSVPAVQVLSTRGRNGWASQDIATAHSSATGSILLEYQFFSEDLSHSLVSPLGPFDASVSVEASEQTPYLRTDYSSGDVENQCLQSCYRPIITGKPGYANVPPGTIFGEEELHRFVGATPDLSHILLTSDVALTSTPIVGAGVYEWSGNKLQLVSVLPENGGAAVGGRYNVRGEHGISVDGSRVVWSELLGHLYTRDTVREETVRLDSVQGGTGVGEVGAAFQFASTDGSKVFFTDAQRLTADSGADNKKPDSYECEIVEVAGKLACSLTDLTPLGSGGSSNVIGVLGESEDGSYVYFADNDVLATGAVPGSCGGQGHAEASLVCNLYVRHAGMTKLVAVLSGEDLSNWRTALVNPDHTSRVSSDGRWLAFMSQRKLTGYDNRDAVSGMPDQEVYLYDANTGHVVCASCNPTGARPFGLQPSIEGQSRVTGYSTVWSAASIPGRHFVYHQPRYLFDDGRLFFDSSDALLAQDVNGAEDVYEFEPPGVGDCTTTSARFSVRSGGCVALISPGTSGEESVFLDASGTGGDVFFLTAAKLSSQDYDSALDLYDARECSHASPCFVGSAVAPPACSTGDSCKPSPSPQPAIFGSPSSATFSGAGNVPRQIAGVVKAKSLTRTQKRARALRACQKKRRGRPRLMCERQVRARYSVKRSFEAAMKKGRG